jgi:hypothetical protein
LWRIEWRSVRKSLNTQTEIIKRNFFSFYVVSRFNYQGERSTNVRGSARSIKKILMKQQKKTHFVVDVSIDPVWSLER